MPAGEAPEALERFKAINAAHEVRAALGPFYAARAPPLCKACGSTKPAVCRLSREARFKAINAAHEVRPRTETPMSIFPRDTSKLQALLWLLGSVH